jgi:hypothetical protein
MRRIQLHYNQQHTPLLQLHTTHSQKHGTQKQHRGSRGADTRLTVQASHASAAYNHLPHWPNHPHRATTSTFSSLQPSLHPHTKCNCCHLVLPPLKQAHALSPPPKPSIAHRSYEPAYLLTSWPGLSSSADTKAVALLTLGQQPHCRRPLTHHLIQSHLHNSLVTHANPLTSFKFC